MQLGLRRIVVDGGLFFCSLYIVVYLFLDQNQLTGTISTQLVALSSLRVLHLSTNAVEGELLNIIDGLENLGEYRCV